MATATAKPARSAARREYEKHYKRQKRAPLRRVVIPPPIDWERRVGLEQTPRAWLRWYFGGIFTYEFTAQQNEIINAVASVLEQGGRKAIAASRGEGKSVITACLVMWALLSGKVGSAMLFAATGGNAEDLLDEIKEAIATNERLLADYPEVCVPVRELADAPQRAGYMTADGVNRVTGKPFEQARLKFSWCGNQLIFPRVPGSPSSGAVLGTKGLDSAFRGKRTGGRRVDFAVIDDPDTEESADSPTQSAKLTKRIKRAIAGLGGQQRPIGIVLITTISSRTSVSARFTDRQQEPAWRGERFAFLIRQPANAAAWQKYIAMYLEDLVNGDDLGRRSHEFYLANRESMDAGAMVANPNRFDPTCEASALEHYYRWVAVNGVESARTELDNDPPDEDAATAVLLRPSDLLVRLSGFPRGVVPPGCTVVTQGIDCHGPGTEERPKGLVWVVTAWGPGATPYVIDCGHTDWARRGRRGTAKEWEAVDDIDIPIALRRRADEYRSAPPRDANGNPVPIQATLVDVRYRMDAVTQAIRSIGGDMHGAAGYGKSAGCAKAGFAIPQGVAAGDGWYVDRESRHVHFAADQWKRFVHARCRVTPHEPSGLLIFGGAAVESHEEAEELERRTEFAEHVCAEQEYSTTKNGFEVVKFVGVARDGRLAGENAVNNHMLDAFAMSAVAANRLGIRLAERVQRMKRLTVAELRARAGK